MSLRYLFPCENCEHQFELVTTQAGQELECPQCQHRSEAPILGKLRQLKLVDDLTPPLVNRESGRGLKNYLFAGGLAIAILAGVAGGWVYQYASSMINEYDVTEVLNEFDSWVDELNPAQVVQFYEEMKVGEGLSEWREQPHIGETRQGRILQKFACGLLGLSGLGLLMMLGSFLIRR